MRIDRQTDVLVVVDIQNDFCPGGNLAVRDGDAVVPVVNRLIEKFDGVVLTQDWHPADHSCFASQRAGGEAFTQTEMSYGPQTLWPDHCVQGTDGAAFHQNLNTAAAEMVIRKGFRQHIDSYSAFFENDQVTATGLAGYLRERGYHRAFFCGLAMDFCVGFSALDARRAGFSAFLVEDACRAIDLDGSLAAMRENWQTADVAVLQSGDIT